MVSNPYQSTILDTGEDVTVRRFRWRTIPAGLSFFVAAMLFIVGVFWLYQFFAESPNRSEFLGSWLIGAMTLVLFSSALLNLVAGQCWIAGRWMSALTCNFLGGLALCGISMPLMANV